MKVVGVRKEVMKIVKDVWLKIQEDDGVDKAQNEVQKQVMEVVGDEEREEVRVVQEIVGHCHKRSLRSGVK